jgi:cytochrome c oxidase subunit II
MKVKRNQFLMIAPLFVFVLLSWKTEAQDTQPGQATTASSHDIQLTCKKYAFSPDPVRVKKGEHVRLIITATDHDHGIKLEAFQIEQKLKKGVPTTVEFTADKAGTFPFKCSVFCGLGHGGMKGTLVVEE